MNTNIQSAIILKYRPYSESDMIVDIFTKDLGMISLMAKGIRKNTSKNKGSLRHFCIAEIEYIAPKKAQSLGKLIRIHPQITLWDADIKDQALFSLCSECIQSFCTDDLPHPEIFALWEELLHAQKISYTTFFAFVCRLFTFLGIFPSFTHESSSHTKFTPQKVFYWEKYHGVSRIPSQEEKSDEKTIEFQMLKFLHYASHNPLKNTEKVQLTSVQVAFLWDIIWWFYSGHQKFFPRSKKIVEDIWGKR